MKKNFFVFLIVAIVSAFISCQEEPPVAVDGNAELIVHAVWDTSRVDSVHAYAPLAYAKMILSSEYGVSIKYADANGVLDAKGIPSAVYQISARAPLPGDSTVAIVGNIKNVEVNSGHVAEVVIEAEPVSAKGIAINELYVGGPVNNIYFFYDQFIELYNSSDSVKYLDGMEVFRISATRPVCSDPYAPKVGDPGSDWGGNGTIDGVTYAFKFPGKPGEKNYPFPPKTFLVLAQDAYDHRQSVSTSIDLSHADWEFVNQLSATDFDNPNVPNLTNMLDCRTTDFMISLTADIVIIADGRDTTFTDGIDIDTIIDGVEYQSSGNKRITLDDRIDRGWVQSPPKYSGQSMQRRQPGVDTNDGTLDWEILPHPTPGYQ